MQQATVPVPSRPGTTRLRRRLPAVVLAFLAVVLLGACTGQKDPTHYSDGVKKNFIDGCVTAYAPGGVPANDPQAKSHRTTCECLIGKITAPEHEGGIPFKQFADAQSKIRDDPGRYKIGDVLPKYDAFVKACAPGAAGPQAPASTSTTAAP